MEDVETIVSTDKEVYTPGENITNTITLTNNGNDVVPLSNIHSPPWNIIIEDQDGNTILRMPEIVMPVIIHYNLQPNETLTYMINLTLNYEPGFYKISGNAYMTPSASTWIEIDTPPVAEFTFSPSIAYLGAELTIDASNSSDEFDSIDALRVRWDWEDDGAWDTPWLREKIVRDRYLYWEIGNYTIRLEVKDTNGFTNQTTKQIEVLLDNESPILAINQKNDSIITNRNATFSWQSWDNESGINYFLYRLDKYFLYRPNILGEWQQISNNSIELKNLNDGTYLLTILAIDKVGNSAEQTIEFRVILEFEDDNAIETEGLIDSLLLIIIIIIAGILSISLFLFIRKKKVPIEPK